MTHVSTANAKNASAIKGATGGGGSRRPYAGHKQPGLHGCKSFGAFWGETSSLRSTRKNDYGQQRDALVPCEPTTAIECQRREPCNLEFRAVNGGGVGGSGIHREAAGKKLELGIGLGGAGVTEVVPAISGMRCEKSAADLAPVRGISRVLAMGS